MMRLFMGSWWTLIAGSIASGGHLCARIMGLSNAACDCLGPELICTNKSDSDVGGQR